MADGRIYGVLTGDVIRSTRLKKEYGDALITFIRNTLDDAGKNNIMPYSIFRGDSFQGITRNPENALEDAIFIRLSLIASRYSGNTREDHLDARIAIGVGTIDYLPENMSVGEGDGEAFRNSGPELDEMKADNKKLIVKTPWDGVDREFEIHCASLDRSLDTITPKQAEAMYYYLKGLSQQEIAGKLGVTQSAISNRIKHADYQIIEKIMAAYKQRIQEELTIQEHLKDKGSEAKWLLDLGSTYFERFNYQNALSHFEKSLRMAGAIGDHRTEAQALHMLGQVYQETDRFEEALDAYARSLAIAREIGDRDGEARTLHRIGRVYQEADRFEGALDAYARSLAIVREIGDRDGEARTLHQIGRIYQETDRFEEALDAYARSLAIAREIGDRDGEARTLHRIGRVYQETDRFEEALDAYARSLAIAREIGDRDGAAGTLHQIGRIYQETDRFEEALDSYARSLAIAREIGDRSGEARTLLVMGMARRGLDQPDRAIEIFTDLIGRFGTSENPEILAYVASAQSQVSGMKKETAA
ncbi:MAG: hypothetical protein PWP08_431 [Methanofollis sp.]|nr:hypothetical protein [Methanofollis sp.]